MIRNMFYFADLDYRMLINNKDSLGLEDSCLVLCQQMIEKCIKGLLRETTGEYPEKHNLSLLIRLYDKIGKFKKYRNLCTTLTDCYYERRYESDSYYEYDLDEYNELVSESIEFYKKLLIESNDDTAKEALSRRL